MGHPFAVKIIDGIADGDVSIPVANVADFE